MRIIIAIFRLICLFFVSLFCFTIGLIILPFLPKQIAFYLARLWGKTTLISIGAKIDIIGNSGDYIQPNCIVIANHVSWLDIPVVYATYAVSFVARIEIKNWPILGRLMKRVDTLFIDRSKKRDIINVNQVVSKQLSNGGTIGLFPEGKTSDGAQVLQFRAPLLENAITTHGCQVIPLVIKYHDANGQRSTNQVTYAGDVTLFQTIKNTLLIDKLHIKIHILPKVNANTFAKRNELSNFLYAQINSCYMADNNLNPQPDDKMWDEDEIGAIASINNAILNQDDTGSENLEASPIKVTDNI